MFQPFQKCINPSTLKGFIAILLWSCSLGLMRSITESFGALVGGR